VAKRDFLATKTRKLKRALLKVGYLHYVANDDDVARAALARAVRVVA